MKHRQKLQAFYQPHLLEAGCDEAGRGCLAGPVVAAAVIWPSKLTHPLLNDSKQLNEEQREHLVPVIKEHAISWAIGICNPSEIDQINILQASFLAMHRAIDGLTVKPELLLIDGNRFVPYWGIPHVCQVKGDGRFLSIAAASILAKTSRDAIMNSLHLEFPQYNWMQNKGYPTTTHRLALAEYGQTPHHRKTFKWQKP